MQRFSEDTLHEIQTDSRQTGEVTSETNYFVLK